MVTSEQRGRSRKTGTSKAAKAPATRKTAAAPKQAAPRKTPAQPRFDKPAAVKAVTKPRTRSKPKTHRLPHTACHHQELSMHVGCVGAPIGRGDRMPLP